VAGQFELKGELLEGPVAKLSGGWQTRVKLAELLLHEPNLLLLDEPTNFLDLRTQILLEHFLQRHHGACLVVSHDRAFLSSTCSQTLDLSHGKLTLFPGKIEAFLEHQRRRLGEKAASRRVYCQKQSAGQHCFTRALQEQATGAFGTNRNCRG
jgi:ATP-binding cassette subfamily F protein 3